MFAPWRLAFVRSAPLRIDALERRSLEVRVLQEAVLQIRALEVGVRSLGSRQVRALQVLALLIGMGQILLARLRIEHKCRRGAMLEVERAGEIERDPHCLVGGVREHLVERARDRRSPQLYSMKLGIDARSLRLWST
jgi:hypothetical protein